MKDREEFAKDAAEGMTIGKLAKKHGIAWGTARDWKKQLELAGPNPSMDTPAATDSEETGEFFDITIRLDGARLIDLLRGTDTEELLTAIERLTPAFHADILQATLQQKFDRLLEPKAVQSPQIQLVGFGG